MWLRISKVIIASRAEERRNRMEKTSARWACPLGLMGLKWQSVYVERSSTAGPRELRRPVSLPPCAAHHPIQMKCKSQLSPVPTMSIPLWLPLSPPSIQHLSSLLVRSLSFSTPRQLCLFAFFSPATCHRKCSQLKLKPVREFYHTKLNKSDFKNTSAVNYFIYLFLWDCVC